MDKNLKMLIKDNKVDKLCGNNMVGIIKTVTSMKSNFEFLKSRYRRWKGFSSKEMLENLDDLSNNR